MEETSVIKGPSAKVKIRWERIPITHVDSRFTQALLNRVSILVIKNKELNSFRLVLQLDPELLIFALPRNEVASFDSYSTKVAIDEGILTFGIKITNVVLIHLGTS